MTEPRMDTNIHEIEKSGDFPTQWIFAQYELGRTVADIAAEMGTGEAVVYARMRVCPETYEQVKQTREELYGRRLRRVRGMCDAITLDYLERLRGKLKTCETDEEKDGLYEAIEKVLKIGRQYAERVQLAEGKATANIGNAGGLPFKISVTETIENGTTNGHEEHEYLTTEDTD